MKKILAILASLTLVASTSATVIACGNNEQSSDHDLYNTVRLKKELRSQLILQLKNDPNLGIDINDLWKDQNIDEIIDQFIDDQISKLYTEKTDTDLGKDLFLGSANQNPKIQFGTIDEDNNQISKNVDNVNHSNSLMSFLTKYSASLTTSKMNALDNINDHQYGPFNPNWVNGKAAKNVGIYYKNSDGKYNRWTGVSDLDEEADGNKGQQTAVALGQFIPDVSMLNEKTEFYLVANGKQLVIDALPAAPTDTTTENDVVLLETTNGVEAVGYRFQTYLRGLEKNNLANILAIQYMKREMYSIAARPIDRQNPSTVEIASKKAAYFNRDSYFVQNAQKWNLKNNSEENFDTDLKMVWTISFNKDEEKEYDEKDKDGNNVKVTKTVYSKINEILNINQDTRASGNGVYATYSEKTESMYGIKEANTKSSNVLEILRLLTQIDGQPMAENNADATISRINTINKSNKGIDPIFGIKGFQGFTRDTDSSITPAIEGAQIDLQDNTKAKIKEANGPAVIKGSASGADQTDFTFKSADESLNTMRDIVLVLPVYLVDLWKTVTNPTGTTTPPAENTDQTKLINLVTDQWIPLLPQVKPATGQTSWYGLKPATSADWVEVTNNDAKTYPTTTSFKKVDDRYYIYIPKTADGTPQAAKDLVVGEGNNAATLSFSWTTDDNATWEYDHNFGIEGVGSDPSQVTDPLATNGQQVKYNIHLGQDAGNLANNYQRLWQSNTGNARYKRSDDLAYLTAKKKNELVDTLLYLVATGDGTGSNSIINTAKIQTYSLYINKDDIYYKALYDRIIGYIRVDDNEEESD